MCGGQVATACAETSHKINEWVIPTKTIGVVDIEKQFIYFWEGEWLEEVRFDRVVFFHLYPCSNHLQLNGNSFDHTVLISSKNIQIKDNILLLNKRLFQYTQTKKFLEKMVFGLMKFMQMMSMMILEYSFQTVVVVLLDFVFLWTASSVTNSWMMIDLF